MEQSLTTLIKTLEGITGPLGPQMEFEQRLKDQEAWKAALTENQVSDLKVLLNWSDGDWLAHRFEVEEVRVLLADGLVQLLGKSPEVHQSQLQELLQGSAASSFVIESMEAFPPTFGIPLLKAVLNNQPDEEICIAIASTLGTWQVSEAEKVLHQMAHDYQGQATVLEEVQIALGE